MRTNRIRISTIVVLLLSFFWLMPLILIFFNSFKSYNDMMQHFLAFPKSFGLDMYIETWVKFDFPKLIGNTVIYSVSTVLLIVLMAPMAAYKLARVKGKFSVICFLLIILPMMIPFQSYMISLTKFVSNVGLIGTRQGQIVVSTGLCMPLAVYMIHGFIKNVPIDLEESAHIDGAGSVRTYFAIILPLLKPILATVVILDALATWNDIIVNLFIAGSNTDAINIQNALYMKFSTTNSDWEHALPGIVMSIIPSLIFFIFMQKNIVAGVTAGAVKG